MRLGVVIGLTLGLVFAKCLSSLIKSINLHKQARKSNMLYYDILYKRRPKSIYLRLVQRFRLDSFISSRLIEVLSYIMKILLMLTLLIVVVVLVVLNYSGYDVWFESVW